LLLWQKNYGAADDRAAENVFFTTIVSLLTLPFIYYIASYFVNNIF
jgi:predicted permease